MPYDDNSLLQLTDAGFYCPQGDFYIDPWQAVQRAVVTHAHADHFRWGCHTYLAAAAGESVFRARLGYGSVLETIPYGQVRTINGVSVSLHPAGHILGSAQVRVEYRGQVWVASGDYKRQPDATCAPFEPLRCHGFITEATFGLPIYRWQPAAAVFGQIDAWWRANRDAGKSSVIYAYALGKAQRLIAGVDASIAPIYTHGAVERLNEAYRAAGVPLPPTTRITDAPHRADTAGALVIAPVSARGTPWLRRAGDHASAFASGWMRIRGARRRRAVDRGFVISDHVDWPDLLDTVAATGAQRVIVTHGYTAVVARWLRDHGVDAVAAVTRYEGETASDTDTADSDAVDTVETTLTDRPELYTGDEDTTAPTPPFNPDDEG